ncbi:MAG: hypothetical protein ACREQW_22225 [Candidatus Binatia bacterium]
MQSAAESGSLRKQRLVREISLGGRLQALSEKAIQRALENDPLCRYYADGNILLQKEIIATDTSNQDSFEVGKTAGVYEKGILCGEQLLDASKEWPILF